MKKGIKLIDKISDFFAGLSAFFLFAIVILILSNIFLMAIANKSILITAEYSGYMFAAFVMFGLSYTFKEKAHIRITFMVNRFPKNIRKFLKILTLAIAGILSFFMAYHSGIMVYKAYIYKMRADTVAQTLLWIPQSCLPFGFFALGIQIISEMVKELR